VWCSQSTLQNYKTQDCPYLARLASVALEALDLPAELVDFAPEGFDLVGQIGEESFGPWAFIASRFRGGLARAFVLPRVRRQLLGLALELFGQVGHPGGMQVFRGGKQMASTPRGVHLAGSQRGRLIPVAPRPGICCGLLQHRLEVAGLPLQFLGLVVAAFLRGSRDPVAELFQPSDKLFSIGPFIHNIGPLSIAAIPLELGADSRNLADDSIELRLDMGGLDVFAVF
jgi:hypothetical protein